ncbi:MAG: ribonuclease [Devosia sp.]
MNPRFSLAVIALILVGGAIALWWSDRQRAIDPVGPAISSEEAVVPPNVPAFGGEYVLTISWHPAFCETKPNLRECRNEQTGDYAADHFSLHGLWPQDDEYCGVSDGLVAIDDANRWDDLPEVEVSDATWRDLVRVMPGTSDSLERHEWVLHGTCAGASADTYFKRAIALVEEVNGSAVQELLERNIDRHVSRNQIRAAFDAAFGDGAGRKVRLDCEADGDRDLVFELRINLEGAAMEAAGLHDLIHAAHNASAGCNGGTVDRVGAQ